MPEVLTDFVFPRGKEKAPKFQQLLDGQTWKVHHDEYDHDNAKALITAIKKEAKDTMGRYVQTSITLSGHVVVRLQPEGYVPRKIGGRKKADKAAA